MILKTCKVGNKKYYINLENPPLDFCLRKKRDHRPGGTCKQLFVVEGMREKIFQIVFTLLLFAKLSKLPISGL